MVYSESSLNSKMLAFALRESQLWFTRTMLYGFKLLEQVKFEILFSVIPNKGLIMKNVKYVIEASWPISVNGGSTGLVAAQVMMMNVVVKVQNISCIKGRNVMDRIWEVWVNGVVKRMAMDMTKARAPPSLFGIDRRMP